MMQKLIFIALLSILNCDSNLLRSMKRGINIRNGINNYSRQNMVATDWEQTPDSEDGIKYSDDVTCEFKFLSCIRIIIH